MVTDGKPGSPRPAASAIEAHASAPDRIIFGLDQSQVRELEKYIKISPRLLPELGALVAEWRARNFERDKNFNRSPFESWRQICETYGRLVQTKISIHGILYNDGAAIYVDPIRDSLMKVLTSIWNVEEELKKIVEQAHPVRGNSGRKPDAKPAFTREVQLILQRHGMSLIRYDEVGNIKCYEVTFLLLLLQYSNFGIVTNAKRRSMPAEKSASSKNIVRSSKHKTLNVSNRTATNLIKTACRIGSDVS